jgi:hypothetical protein
MNQLNNLQKTICFVKVDKLEQCLGIICNLKSTKVTLWMAISLAIGWYSQNSLISFHWMIDYLFVPFWLQNISLIGRHYRWWRAANLGLWIALKAYIANIKLFNYYSCVFRISGISTLKLWIYPYPQCLTSTAFSFVKFGNENSAKRGTKCKLILNALGGRVGKISTNAVI